ncbi:hypothetical protein IEQ11_10910 [Lysobacter capsici]|uniref:hypothetical protein n=1 Tax=Lysobacter capsici TaxID=435897 RepID=UPI00177DD7D1|nr:hypothetical protein [Lysobacter capsici]UOF17099.1 hypothetical protein IEQ11_10910 [Lysobacter capsici]
MGFALESDYRIAIRSQFFASKPACLPPLQKGDRGGFAVAVAVAIAVAIAIAIAIAVAVAVAVSADKSSRTMNHPKAIAHAA